MLGPCPRCDARLETPLACAGCGALLEDEPEARSPFELFGLAPTHEVDAGDLRKRLLRLSRLVHPDFFAAAGGDARERAERASAALNGAHAVLADEARRADWLVRHLGGPSDGDERQMPQAFLMEVLEWNERLEEAREAGPGSDARAGLPAFAATLRSEREARLAAARALLVPLPERAAPALADARRELNAVRYLDRALREVEALRLDEAASQAPRP